MNNLTDFPKKVETSLDPRLYQVAIALYRSPKHSSP